MSDKIALTPPPTNFLTKVAGFVPTSKRRHQQAIIAAITPRLVETMSLYGINNDFRVCHFIGQCCEESDSFCTTEEYASGAAYEGRKDLGNTHKGDGRRFKGRGLFMVTGRANYLHYGVLLGLDLVGEPELAADPVTSLRLAGAYWKEKGCSPLADSDDIVSITRKINGGLNGLDLRRTFVGRAFDLLGYT